MIRGTDTGFRFKIPCNYEDLSWVAIKFWQPNNNGTADGPLPIIKTKDNCYSGGENLLLVMLTAEETARFSDRLKAYVQMRGYGGATFGCKKTPISVYSMEDDLIGEYNDYVVLDGGVVDANILTYTIVEGDIIS